MKKSVEWPGQDDRAVITEMLHDPSSHHWEKCYHFMQKIIGMQVNLPDGLKDDVVQNAMVSVMMSLPNFKYESKLTTWLIVVANNRTRDLLRNNKRLDARPATLFLNASLQDDKNEINSWQDIVSSPTVEDECIQKEMLRETLTEIRRFVLKHNQSERNRQILKMALLEGYNFREIAQELGISAPVVGYVVRSAQRHLREKRDIHCYS